MIGVSISAMPVLSTELANEKGPTFFILTGLPLPLYLTKILNNNCMSSIQKKCTTPLWNCRTPLYDFVHLTFAGHSSAFEKLYLVIAVFFYTLPAIGDQPFTSSSFSEN